MAKQIRMGVIACLIVVGLNLLGADTVDGEPWGIDFLVSKLIAIAMLGIGALLHIYWDRRGLLPETNYYTRRNTYNSRRRS